VTIGDFNRDGKIDLATSNFVSDNISVLLGDGTGGFSAASNFPAGDGPSSLVTGDFNADGTADLVIANNNSTDVSVLLGVGSGGFGAATSVTTGDFPEAVTTGDFNRDGKTDIAVANRESDTASVLLNNCDAVPCDGASFDAATNFATGTGPQSVTTGDFNLDGIPDLATANIITDNVSVLLGNGAGGFLAAANFAAGGPRELRLATSTSTGGRPGGGERLLCVCVAGQRRRAWPAR
jgi:hypothetical protein